METVSKIRRWVKVDGMSIKEVVRRTGLSRNTVRKYLRDENAEPQYRMTKERGSRRLLDHEVHLKGMYEADLSRPPRERRSMQGLYEDLVGSCVGTPGFARLFLVAWNKIECGRVSGLIFAAFHTPRAGMVCSLIRSNSIPRAFCARPLSGFPDQFTFNRRPYFPEHSLFTDTYF